MIPAFLAPIATRLATAVASKTSKIILIGIIMGLLAAIFFYYKHSVYKQGYNEAVANYEQRDADTSRKSQKLLALAQDKYERELSQQKERHDNAIKYYAEQIITLKHDADIASRKRMFVTTKTERSNCNSNTVSAGAKAGSGIGGTGSQVQKSELTTGAVEWFVNRGSDAQELNIACQAILDQLGY